MAKRNILFIVVVAFIIFFGATGILNRTDDTKKLHYYLPLINDKKVSDLKFKKILSDPSYDQPYNIYISYEINEDVTNEKIIKDLGLNNIANSDIVELRRNTWKEEYDIFFSMQSLNSRRNTSLLSKEREISWWRPTIQSKIVNAYFFFDDLKSSKPVGFDKRHNGRIVISRNDGRLYILIESWG